jgi:cardiolipin synthase A/B
MPRYLNGNEITLLRNGAEFFPAIIAAIDRARASIFLESYIFASDVTGVAVAAALSAAARRGVAVHVLIDGYGTKHYTDDDAVQDMRTANVMVSFYRPDVFRNIWSRTRLRRLHRKLLVIDGEVGFIGGINIIDDLHTPRHTPPRIDFAVRVRGPVLQPMIAATARLWNVTRFANPRQGLSTAETVEWNGYRGGHSIAKFVVRDNLANRRDIERAYLAAIRTARGDVLIANAYFFPGIRFRRALVRTAKRGIRVRVLVQARTEYAMMNLATKALYGQLLAGGVEIYEYNTSFLHAKVAVVDERWATVGSSNIDPLSLLLAREANVVVKDELFTGQLRTELERLLERGASKVDPQTWAQRPLTTRIGHWMTYGLVRTLISYFAFGAKDYR